MSDQVYQTIHDALASSISRVVAVLIPVLAGGIGAALYWLQNVIGIDLQVDPAVAATFVGTVVLGSALAGLKWLEGRAGFEQAAVKLVAAREAGQAQLRQPPGHTL